jgi:putative ABC transport system permease protein
MDALKDQHRMTPRSAGKLAGSLVVSQMAVSLVLLVCAGLFLRSFVSLTTRALGFIPDQILVARMDAQRAAIAPEQRMSLFEHARDAVHSLPNVADAALSMTTPFGGNAFVPPVEIAGVPLVETTQQQVAGYLISPGWLRTFGTPLVAGRDLTERDRTGARRVAIVNEAFARRFSDGRSPIGSAFTLFPGSTFARRTEIVGVVRDAISNSLRDPVAPTLYVPLAQFEDMPQGFLLPWTDLSVRSKAGSPALLTRSVAAAVTSVSPDLSLTFHPLSEQIDASLTKERVVAMLSMSFAALGLLLAAIGLYGVTSYGVVQRRAEIGIRVALGATSHDVVRLVLSRVARLVIVGIFIGAAISAWASTLLATLLYDMEPRDPLTFITAAVVLIVAAALAGWLPARRASRLDPSITLRYE